MTDFFADLERELRAAHPRRSRPVVPARGIALTAAAAATLAAVVLALGAVGGTGEREVAAPQLQEGWTAYAPLDCDGSVVDGRIPDALVDRFATLRGDGAAADLPGNRIPEVAAEVIRQSLRVVDGPGGTRYVFAIVRMGDERCEPGEHAVCLISLQSENSQCGVSATEPVHLVEDFAGGRRIVAVVAGDGVERVAVSTNRRGVIAEVDLEANTGFQVIPGGDDDPQVTAEDEAIPLGCSTEPAMSALRERFAIFREPPSKDTAGIEIALPADWHRVFRQQARVVGGFMVFPAGHVTCATGVCMVRYGRPEASCARPPAKADAVVLTVEAEHGVVGVLATDGVSHVTVRGTRGETKLEVLHSVASGSVRGQVIEVRPGS